MPLLGESNPRQGFSVSSGFTIDNSVMLSDGDSEKFTKTFADTPSNTKKFTISGWYKRVSDDQYDHFFGAGTGATTGRVQAYTHSNGRIVFEMYHGGGWNTIITDRVFRDTHAWYNLMFVMDIQNPVADDRMRIYVNGERATIDSTGAGGAVTHNPISNTALNHLMFSNSTEMEIGDSGDNGMYDGYMAEVIGLDGRALTSMSPFAENSDNGVWIPKDPTDELAVSTTAESIINTTSAVSGSDTAAYTFSSVALGTASTTRAVYVWTSGQGPSVSAFNVNTMTVGGVSASLVQVADSSAEPQYMGELWRADVPTGTTGDIVVTWNSALSQCGISVWSVDGDHEEFAIGTDLSNSTSSVSFTNVPDNSVILAGRGSTGSVTHTWSADVNENVDEAIESSAGVMHSAASKFHATGGSKTITCTPSSSDSRARMVAIVLSPKQGTGRNGFRLKFDAATNLGRDASVDSVTAPTKTYLSGPETAATAVKTNDATSYTFSSVSFGAAASNRSIVVGIGAGRSSSGARNISSVTIGGVTATIAAEQDSPSGTGSNVAGIAFAEVPTGTSGDIVVTFNATMARCGIGVWSATDLGPVLDTGGDADDANATLTSTLVGSEGAVAFYHLYDEGAFTGASFSNATERYETVSTSWEGDGGQAGADFTFTSAGSVDVVATLADNGNDGAMMGVVFGRAGEHQFVPANSPTQSGDTPSENYAVMSQLHSNAAVFAEGATTAVTDGTDGAQLTGSMAFDSQDSDGYYFIVRPTATSSTIGAFSVGVATVDHANETPTNDATNAGSWFLSCGNGNVTNTSGISNGTWDSQSNGGGSLNDYFQIAVKAGKIYFGKNNTWYDSSDGTFANAGEAFSNLTGMVVPMVQHAHASAGTFQVEFGAFGYTHAKPSGFKDINTTNLKASNPPAIEDGSKYFNTVLYTANNSDDHAITGVGFKPDWVWIKDRDTVASHAVFDAVRGVSGGNKFLVPNTTDTEGQGGATNTLKSLDSDGFTLDDDSDDQRVNFGGQMVSWNWLAANLSDGSGTANGDGTKASVVSANQTAGFSIVTWTHQTSANYTVGHGLGAVPKMIIVKTRNQGTNWGVYHSSLTLGNRLRLNTNNNQSTGYWGTNTFNSTVFSIGTTRDADSSTAVAYCFAQIPGYSAFGSYEGGANSADGRLVRLDFSPAWLMIKNIDNDGESWYIFDNKRPGYNQENYQLIADTTAAEGSGDIVDLLSNGFKIRANDRAYGGTSNTDTYMYMAFAENPFAGSAPATAR